MSELSDMGRKKQPSPRKTTNAKTAIPPPQRLN